MSHFKVLVIGDDIETQLEPYSENLEVEAYKEEDFDFAHELESARSFYIENPETEPEIDRNDIKAVMVGYHGDYGLRWNADCTHAEKWSTYNPKSKWDYWTIGGRYNASLQIRPEAIAADFEPSAHHWSEGFGNEADHRGASDRARKRAIDYPAMIAKQHADAVKRWDEVTAATVGIEPPTESWAQIRDRLNSIDEARAEHNSHPWRIAANKAGFWDAYDTFNMGDEDPRASYIAEREAAAIGGYYAVLHNGEWQARGDMGWFGMSSNESDKTAWVTKVSELIDSLPDETWITTVDCHI